jgi:predicted nucleic acid-binding protein
MRILVDSNFLIYLLDRRSGGNQLDKDRRAKLHDLLGQVEENKGSVLIPSPVLAEYLLNAGSAAQDIAAGLRGHRRIRIAPFDEVAAQEAAIMHRAAWDAGGHKRAPLPKDADWQRIKVDWQVVAIAKVHRARIVTNDRPLCTLAHAAGVQADWLDAMPLPPGAIQMLLEGVEHAPPPALVVKSESRPAK